MVEINIHIDRRTNEHIIGQPKHNNLCLYVIVCIDSYYDMRELKAIKVNENQNLLGCEDQTLVYLLDDTYIRLGSKLFNLNIYPTLLRMW